MAGGPQQARGPLAEFVVHLDRVQHLAGRDEQAVWLGPPFGDLVRVRTKPIRPVIEHRHRAVPGPSTGVRGGRKGAGQHRPPVAGQTDGLGAQLDAEGAPPAIRPIRVQHQSATPRSLPPALVASDFT